MGQYNCNILLKVTQSLLLSGKKRNIHMKSKYLCCIKKVNPEFQEMGECRLIVILSFLCNFALYIEFITRRSTPSGNFSHIYLKLTPYYAQKSVLIIHRSQSLSRIEANYGEKFLFTTMFNYLRWLPISLQVTSYVMLALRRAVLCR